MWGDFIVSKHYENENWYDSRRSVNRTISVRISDRELEILRKLYPNRSLSFAVRSLIHKFGSDCNT